MIGNLPENEKTEYKMEIAPGGMVFQTVFTDNHPKDFWDWKNSIKLDIQTLEASEFQLITGLPPLPPIEVSKIVAGDPQALLAHPDSNSVSPGNEFKSLAEEYYVNPPKESVKSLPSHRDLHEIASEEEN
jgi:hypothetical protein